MRFQLKIDISEIEQEFVVGVIIGMGEVCMACFLIDANTEPK
jgi:hypothetical protein